MFFGIMIACGINYCEPQYKKEYGPFQNVSECMNYAGKALQELPPGYRSPQYTCRKKT